MKVDLLVRGGIVIDGSGAPGFRADVAVDSGVIVAVGPDLGDEISATRHVDAHGLVVAPGFVDAHTHMDAQVFWDAAGSSSAWHGVTTAVMGNCGFSLAPSRDHQRALVLGALERAEDIPAEVLSAGLQWTWSSFAEYLDAVDQAPKGINYAAQIGHSALRTYAMGERAFTEAATDEDLEVMTSELRAGLLAGAVGFTTSRSSGHQTSQGEPVASRLASWGEVRHLASAASEHGAVFQLAPEDAGFPFNEPDERVRDEYQARLLALAVDTGIPVMTPVLGLAGWEELLGRVDHANAHGARMFVLAHTRGIGIVLSFRTQLPFDQLPEWADVRSQPLERQAVLLRDPDVRARLVRAAHAGAYRAGAAAEMRPPDYSLMQVMRSAHRPNPTVADEAARLGVDPVDVIIDTALDSNFEQFLVQPSLPVDDRGVLEILRHPKCLMTFSDSGAHVGQIVDCSIYTHLLSYWVRERQAFPLEHAIAMMTRKPAEAWGLADRGMLRAGYAGDINVFDPEEVAPMLPEVARDLPGGHRRLIQRSRGFHTTVVNGVVTLEHGEPTGDHPGRLLRRAFAAR